MLDETLGRGRDRHGCRTRFRTAQFEQHSTAEHTYGEAEILFTVKDLFSRDSKEPE